MLLVGWLSSGAQTAGRSTGRRWRTAVPIPPAFFTPRAIAFMRLAVNGMKIGPQDNSTDSAKTISSCDMAGSISLFLGVAAGLMAASVTEIRCAAAARVVDDRPTADRLLCTANKPADKARGRASTVI